MQKLVRRRRQKKSAFLEYLERVHRIAFQIVDSTNDLTLWPTKKYIPFGSISIV